MARAVIEEMLRIGVRVLMLADLPHLEQAEARKWASLARLLVRAMLAAHRLALGTVEVEEAAGEVPPYTADELAEAARVAGEAGKVALRHDAPRSSKYQQLAQIQLLQHRKAAANRKGMGDQTAFSAHSFASLQQCLYPHTKL